jgi:VWFA-related protein
MKRYLLPKIFPRNSLVSKILLASTALLGAGLICSARQTASPTESAATSLNAQKPSPTIKVGTRIITVSVVATDHSGNPVKDLKPNEFHVFEKGEDAPFFREKTEERIAQFRFVDTSSENHLNAPPTTAPPQGVYTNQTQVERAAVPPIALLVDALNTQTTNQLEVRRQMLRLLETLPPDVPVAIFLLGRDLRLLQGFTHNTDLLRSAIDKAIEDPTLAQVDPRDDPKNHSSQSAGDTSAPNGGVVTLSRFQIEKYVGEVEMRVGLTLESFQILARYLDQFPGKKNLIWLSESFPVAIVPDPTEGKLTFEANAQYTDRIIATTNILADSQVTVYPVDVRGMDTQAVFNAEQGYMSNGELMAKIDRQTQARLLAEASMRQVAKDTGGRVCRGTNDLADCVKSAMKDGEAYYEIAYYPSNNHWNGEFRNITIKTTRPGVSLHYRRGYYASETATVFEKNEKDAKAETIRTAISSDAPVLTGIPLAAREITPAQSKEHQFFISVGAREVRISPSGQQFETHVDMAIAAFDSNGKMLRCYSNRLNRTLTQAQYDQATTNGLPYYISVPYEPGAVRVRIAVRDAGTGLIGSVDAPLATISGS